MALQGIAQNGSRETLEMACSNFLTQLDDNLGVCTGADDQAYVYTPAGQSLDVARDGQALRHVISGQPLSQDDPNRLGLTLAGCVPAEFQSAMPISCPTNGLGVRYLSVAERAALPQVSDPSTQADGVELSAVDRILMGFAKFAALPGVEECAEVIRPHLAKMGLDPETKAELFIGLAFFVSFATLLSGYAAVKNIVSLSKEWKKLRDVVAVCIRSKQEIPNPTTWLNNIERLASKSVVWTLGSTGLGLGTYYLLKKVHVQLNEKK